MPLTCRPPSKLAGSRRGPEPVTSSVVRSAGAVTLSRWRDSWCSLPHQLPEFVQDGFPPLWLSRTACRPGGGQQGASPYLAHGSPTQSQSQPGLTLDLSQSRRCPARAV